MGYNSTWVTFAHVMNRCTDRVKIKPVKICLCQSCIERINLEKTKEICIVDEARLNYLLQNVEKVDG